MNWILIDRSLPHCCPCVLCDFFYFKMFLSWILISGVWLYWAHFCWQKHFSGWGSEVILGLEDFQFTTVNYYRLQKWEMTGLYKRDQRTTPVLYCSPLTACRLLQSPVQRGAAGERWRACGAAGCGESIKIRSKWGESRPSFPTAARRVRRPDGGGVEASASRPGWKKRRPCGASFEDERKFALCYEALRLQRRVRERDWQTEQRMLDRYHGLYIKHINCLLPSAQPFSDREEQRALMYLLARCVSIAAQAHKSQKL